MRFRTVMKVIVAFAVVVFMAAMSIKIYGDVFQVQSELPEKQRSGIINVWHVVKYKPYTGSISLIIADAARKIENKSFGVYFNVDGITVDEYEKRIARGERADIISFPAGLIDANGLCALDEAEFEMLGSEYINAGSSEGKLYAIAYAQSPCVLIENTALTKKHGISIPEWDIDESELLDALNGVQAQGVLSGCAERWALLGANGLCEKTAAFKEGKAALCLDDIRTAREMSMLCEKGKGFDYAVHGVNGLYGNMLLIAINTNEDEWIKQHGSELIKLLLTEKYAAKIAATGLKPSVDYEHEEGQYTDTVNAAEVLKNAPCINTFLYNRYRDAIGEEAERALAGDSAAHSAIVKRYGELFG